MRMRVLRAGRGRVGALGRRRRRQVCARAVSAAGRGAAPALSARSPGSVRAARVLRAGAVDCGRRAARVAGAAGVGHGGVRGGARRLRGGLRLASPPRPPRRAVPPRRRALRAGRVRGGARRARHAGAAVRDAAGGDGVARAGAGRRRGPRRPAVPRVGRGPRVRAVHRARALQAGAGDVDVLPGPAGDRRQRASHSARGAGRRLRAPAARIRRTYPFIFSKPLLSCCFSRSYLKGASPPAYLSLL